jgi:hypothetical protein
MSTTQPDTTATAQPSVATGYPTAFEVTTLPVADVDRAKAFYLSLGWRLDIDFEPAPDTRGCRSPRWARRPRSSSDPDPERPPRGR